MAQRTKAQRTASRIERLEQTKLILEVKMKVLQVGLQKITAELEELRKT
ncbi:hypothetical protein [Spirosoma panaciterrae]|nr:hypothetical protein [Spirosoma panaciterrae]